MQKNGKQVSMAMSHKLISIEGASFSGKTYLNTNIVLRLIYNTNFSIMLSNVNFEQVYNKLKDFESSKTSFHNLIREKLLKFDVVISECVELIDFEYEDTLTILCCPPMKKIESNYLEYVADHGDKGLDKRLFMDVQMMAYEFDKNYIDKPNTIVYNGFNVEYILEEVEKYVRN